MDYLTSFILFCSQFPIDQVSQNNKEIYRRRKNPDVIRSKDTFPSLNTKIYFQQIGENLKVAFLPRKWNMYIRIREPLQLTPLRGFVLVLACWGPHINPRIAVITRVSTCVCYSHELLGEGSSLFFYLDISIRLPGLSFLIPQNGPQCLEWLLSADL